MADERRVPNFIIYVLRKAQGVGGFEWPPAVRF
jgi:hypothetical protein